AALQAAINARDPTAPVTRMWAVQPLESGDGPINLDEYRVNISAFPMLPGSSTRMTPDALVLWVRFHINDLVDTSIAEFSPYELSDTLKWLSPKPVGACVHIKMTDDGTVLCAESTPDHWIFATTKTRRDGMHPVSGNRMFGVKTTDEGAVFY